MDKDPVYLYVHSYNEVRTDVTYTGGAYFVFRLE